MSESRIPREDVRKLYRLAGFHCSFNGCNVEILKEEKGGIVGNIAHIVAEKEGGPRGHSTLTLEERNCYANLILLCPNHHSLIDNEAEWTVEKLHQMKQEHEEWIKTQLSKGKPCQFHISAGLLHYINLRRLVLDPGLSMYFRSSDFDLDDIGNLSELGLKQWTEMRLLVEQYFKDWKPQVLTLNDIGEENVGARIKFEPEFWTKNVPGPDKLASFKLTGNIQQDPHIYCKIGERKIYVSIDPRYITADTAFSLFRHGRIRFSGLGILNAVTASETRITPIIIGSPNYQESEYLVGSSLIHL